MDSHNGKIIVCPRKVVVFFPLFFSFSIPSRTRCQDKMDNHVHSLVLFSHSLCLCVRFSLALSLVPLYIARRRRRRKEKENKRESLLLIMSDVVIIDPRREANDPNDYDLVIRWSPNWMMTDRVWQFWTWEAWMNSSLISRSEIQAMMTKAKCSRYQRSNNNDHFLSLSSPSGSEVDRRWPRRKSTLSQLFSKWIRSSCSNLM